MKRFVAFFSAFLFFLAPTLADEDARIAIGNVTVITMDGEEVFENAVVIINGDRIESVIEEAELNLFRDVTFIDGTGKFLVPGLTEMHGHIPRATRIDQDLEDQLFLFVSQGVTTVRGMLGNAGQFKLRDKINAGKVLGPTLYLGGPSFNGSSVSSPGQARRMVRDQVAAGWDFLKIHPGLTLAEYDAMADEATSLGITWGGHVPADVGLERALEAGQVTIDHLDGYEIFTGSIAFNGFSNTFEGDSIQPVDTARLEEALRLTREAGTAIVPTNALWEVLVGGSSKKDLINRAEMKYAKPGELSSWARRHQDNRDDPQTAQIIENRRQILKTLSDGGVSILLGSDAPQLYSVPGFSIHREMQAMAEAGLSPEQILTSGTSAVGEFFADKDTFGKIAPGQRADMILLESNPLEDISNMRSIVGVMVRGVWLSREEIDEKLAEIEASNAGWDRF